MHVRFPANMGKKREADRTDGADWGGARGKPVAARVLSHNAGSAKSAKNVIASESPQQTAAPEPAHRHAPIATGSAVAKKKRKKHLGRKEREKLRLKRAKEQENEDEMAGMLAAGGVPPVASVEEGHNGETGGKEKRRRYTVFVGNLPYDSTQQDVFQHFEQYLRGMVLDVRMNHDKGTGQFRGTCFVDLKDPVALTKAYKLHHSKILERKINVEATVGGGGSGENRTKKLQKKQNDLSKLHTRRIAKDATKQKKGAAKRGLGAQKRDAEKRQAKAKTKGSRKGETCGVEDPVRKCSW